MIWNIILVWIYIYLYKEGVFYIMYSDYQGYSANPTPRQPQPPMERHHELAEAHVPDQQYVNAFPPMEALKHGTLFPELVRPYAKRK